MAPSVVLMAGLIFTASLLIAWPLLRATSVEAPAPPEREN